MKPRKNDAYKCKKNLTLKPIDMTYEPVDLPALYLSINNTIISNRYVLTIEQYFSLITVCVVIIAC